VSPRAFRVRGRRVWGSADVSGPCAGVVAPWPFTSAALPVLGCDVRGLAGSQAFTCARPPPTSDPELRGPHLRWGFGNFHSHSPRLSSSLPPLPCDCFLRPPRPRSPHLAVGRAARFVVLSWGCSKIASPSVPMPESPCGAASRRLRAVSMPSGAGLPRRLRAARPGCRPRRLVTTSPVSSSCWLPGCCTRRRSWGSARFTLPRLSPRQRSPRRFPTLRSFVPRGKLPDPLTRALRRLVRRVLLPACASPSPLPPRPSPLPAGASRPCSSLGAVRSGARCRAPNRRCSPGFEPRRPRVAAAARGRVRQRTFERTPSR